MTNKDLYIYLFKIYEGLNCFVGRMGRGDWLVSDVHIDRQLQYVSGVNANRLVHVAAMEQNLLLPAAARGYIVSVVYQSLDVVAFHRVDKNIQTGDVPCILDCFKLL